MDASYYLCCICREMCINVCAYVPICKAVSYSLFWGKASENVKAEGAKRDLLCSLWSFAEIECPGLNLTAKYHIIPYSWLKQAAYPFCSLISLCMLQVPTSSPSYGIQSNIMKIFPFRIWPSLFWQLRESVLSTTLVIVIVPTPYATAIATV